MKMNDHSRLSTAVVRSATAADNEALLTLVRRCPMRGDISLIIERDPDFFGLSRARGDSLTFVVEIDGAIVGCLGTWRRGAWLAGRPAEVCYVGDLRVDPDFRRRGVANQLAVKLRDYPDTLPPAPWLLATGAGNSAVAPVAAAFGAGGPPIARFTSWQLLPVVQLKVSAGFDIGAAEQRDECELVTLLDDFYRSRDFAPVFGNGGLRQLIERSPDARLSDYLVARRGGRIVAAICVWDASSVKRTRVIGMPVWLRGLCAVGRGISNLAPMPPFPRQNTALHFRYIRHAAFAPGETQALKNLVRCAVNAARDRGDHFVLYTCVDDDPSCSAVVGAPRLSFRYSITPVDTSPEPPYFNATCTPSAWCFDDAALD